MPVLAVTAVDVPHLDPADIRVAVDRIGRTVAIVPDDVVRELRLASGQGWNDVPGANYGVSARYAPDTAVTRAIRAIIGKCGNGTTGQPGDAFYGLVVGRSAFNPATGTYTQPYERVSALVLASSLLLDDSDRGYFAG